ncbi:type II toxin-antitoxin system antitoxin, RelB/DinJ family [Candidatus Peregrinibacteria bacterium CG_4_9_14_0_2_um_filter_53_11]|nr:MAG: type II toxin-antitoxin system antitoxin, RelB/DinJ family [Candidatus Peregrinibacteria bacterium CG_4_9_14_0_2_um_filter_53_11]
MSTIQIRIDEKTKKQAKKVLDTIGMDMSSAIKVYLKQVVITQGIPFQLLTENGLTIQQEQEILKASEEAKRGVNVSGPFETAEDLIKDLKE